MDYVDVKVTERNNQEPIQDSYGINIVRNSGMLPNHKSRSSSRRNASKKSDKVKEFVKCVAINQGPIFEQRNVTIKDNHLDNTFVANLQ